MEAVVSIAGLIAGVKEEESGTFARAFIVLPLVARLNVCSEPLIKRSAFVAIILSSSVCVITTIDHIAVLQARLLHMCILGSDICHGPIHYERNRKVFNIAFRHK